MQRKIMDACRYSRRAVHRSAAGCKAHRCLASAAAATFMALEISSAASVFSFVTCGVHRLVRLSILSRPPTPHEQDSFSTPGMTNSRARLK